MKIIVRDNLFVLETAHTHYVLGVDDAGIHRHIHWGKPCDVRDYEMKEVGDENSNHSMLDALRQEYTPWGETMYRECAVKARFADGCREMKLRYDGHDVKDNRLSLRFTDPVYPLEVTLHYEIFPDSDVIARWTTLKNPGGEDVVLEKAASAELSLPSEKPYTIRNTNGAWGGEYRKAESVLTGGSLVFESRRGTSGHNHAPFFIAYQNADETSGDVYFAVLAYSGNFKVSASRDLFSVTRVVLGLNDFDFEHVLHAGASLVTPKVFCGYTQGFGAMTRMMHRFAREHVLPQPFAQRPLPVLYNSWEATGFDVSARGQMALADLAAELGVELFVMDDGWFGARKDDRAGLGDWTVNAEKFPHGLDELISHVNARGMDFGLWVEPEMVNPDSDLYRAHPDWAYHYPTRKNCELRNQLVLNMTKKEVQDYIRTTLDGLLTRHNIRYIKWDMNRPISEAGAENLENGKMLWYAHTMAVYEIVDFLKQKHPDVAIESCASGGGRSDYGALSHFDQVWTSDNTDAIDRLVIQDGYALLHPAKAMRAWVTDVSGINKPMSLAFRFNVAMRGALGLGGDLTKYSEADKAVCKKSIALYKEVRDLVQFGDLYRLLNIDECEISAVQYVNDAKTESVVFIAADGTRFYKKEVPLLLAGLDETKRYRFEFDGDPYEKGGAYLMHVGLPLRVRGASYNQIIRIREAK